MLGRRTRQSSCATLARAVSSADLCRIVVSTDRRSAAKDSRVRQHVDRQGLLIANAVAASVRCSGPRAAIGTTGSLDVVRGKADGNEHPPSAASRPREEAVVKEGVSIAVWSEEIEGQLTRKQKVRFKAECTETGRTHCPTRRGVSIYDISVPRCNIDGSNQIVYSRPIIGS